MDTDQGYNLNNKKPQQDPVYLPLTPTGYAVGLPLDGMQFFTGARNGPTQFIIPGSIDTVVGSLSKETSDINSLYTQVANHDQQVAIASTIVDVPANKNYPAIQDGLTGGEILIITGVAITITITGMIMQFMADSNSKKYFSEIKRV